MFFPPSQADLVQFRDASLCVCVCVCVCGGGGGVVTDGVLSVCGGVGS